MPVLSRQLRAQYNNGGYTFDAGNNYGGNTGLWTYNTPQQVGGITVHVSATIDDNLFGILHISAEEQGWDTFHVYFYNNDGNSPMPVGLEHVAGHRRVQCQQWYNTNIAALKAMATAFFAAVEAAGPQYVQAEQYDEPAQYDEPEQYDGQYDENAEAGEYEYQTPQIQSDDGNWWYGVVLSDGTTIFPGCYTYNHNFYVRGVTFPADGSGERDATEQEADAATAVV
jgi:hypothetical protein